MLEKKVYELLAKRGYDVCSFGVGVDGYLKYQFIKSSEEFGEIARHLFDDKTPPAEEIADTVIPLLAMCAVLGYDFEQEVLRKASGDVERGVRGSLSGAVDVV